MDKVIQEIIDKVAGWELEDLEALANKLNDLIAAKEEDLPDDDDGR